MQLNQLIQRLEHIRTLVNPALNPQVLWRDPRTGQLFDEFVPYLTQVFEDDVEQLTAFDLELNEAYVEL